MPACPCAAGSHSSRPAPSPGACPFSVASPHGVTHGTPIRGRCRAVPSAVPVESVLPPAAGGLPSAGPRSCPFRGCQPCGGHPSGRAPWGWAEALVGTKGSPPCPSPPMAPLAQRVLLRGPLGNLLHTGLQGRAGPPQGGSESRHCSEIWERLVRTGLWGCVWGPSLTQGHF